MKTTNAVNVNAPKMEGQEIIAHSLPSDNNVDNDTQGLEDMAGLPFGHDDAEHEDRSFNQTRGLFNKRNMMISLCIAVIVFLCVVTGISSAALTNNNNSVVVESFNGAPGAAKASKAPTTAKAGKCIPNTHPGTIFEDTECSAGCDCCCNTDTSCPNGWTPACKNGPRSGNCLCRP